MTYGIFDKATDEKVFETQADSEAEALDFWAAHRSGYDTMSRMAQSATFRHLTNVHAYRIAD